MSGDAAKVVQASSVTTAAQQDSAAVTSATTTITGLKVLGETVDLPTGQLADPVTRSHSVESDDVVSLLRGLGIDPADIDQYAPLVGSSYLAARLDVTVSTRESGGLGVDLGVDVELKAVSAGDDTTPAGSLFNVELTADNTLFSATFAGTQNADEHFEAPTVTDMTPLTVTAGDTITVTGSGFVTDRTTVGLADRTINDVTILNDGTTITFIVPAEIAGADLPVRITTPGGSITAGNLTVNAPVAITSQPQDLTVDSGQDVNFSIGYSGFPAPTIQWQFRTALGGAWTNIDSQTFPSALTGTLTLPASVAWDGLEVRAMLTDSQDVEIPSDPAVLHVNQVAAPGTSDLSALTSPVSVGAIALVLSGQATGGTFAGLINGELSKGVELGDAGRYTLTETDTPRVGQQLTANYPAGSKPEGNNIGDLAAGVEFGPVTVSNEHLTDRITASTNVESFVLTDKAFDSKGRIGGVGGFSEIIEATNITATATATSNDTEATQTATSIGQLRILGQDITEADGLVNGVIETPITKEFVHTVDDIPAVLEDLNLSVTDYFEDPSELVGHARVTIQVTVFQVRDSKQDTAEAIGLVVTGKADLELVLEPVGSAAAFVKKVEIASGGFGDFFEVELSTAKVARNGAELPNPGDSGGPGGETPEPGEPEEPEEPLDPISYKPSQTPDRIILNPTATPATSQAVTWRTDATVTSNAIEYWPTELGSAAKKSLTATTGEPFTATSDAEGSYDVRKHSAVLTDLTPKTSYTYRVGSEGNYSPLYTFKTSAATAEPLKFMYVGDAQNDLRRRWEPAIRKAHERLTDADLVLHAGDQINHADQDSEWGEWFTATVEPAASKNQVMVAGNHEYVNGSLGPLWRQSYTLPANGPTVTAQPGTCEYVYQRKMTESMKDIVYYTDYQGVRFVTLGGTTQAGDLMPTSSELASVECADDFNFLNYWFQIQAEWLDKVLEDNPGNWSVVSIHQPIFSTSTGRDNTHLRDLLLPTIEKHNVDLVLQGHDHTYGRGHLKSNNVAGKNGLQTGPVYVVSVLGPKSYELDRSEDNDWASNGAERVTAYEKVRTYQDITIDGGHLTYQAVEWETGDVVDSFEICKSPNGNKVATKSGQADLPDNCDQPSTLAALSTPTIVGVRQVGEALFADLGTWNDLTAVFSYQWQRDGANITGATERTYRLVAADAGHVISVVVTATSANSTLSVTSQQTETVKGTALANYAAPQVNGTLQVGSSLSTNGGQWSQEANKSYQWLADGQPIPGATNSQITLDAELVQTVISVRVTASIPGYDPIVAQSASSGPVAPGVIVMTAAPLIDGTSQVGRQLTVSAGAWEAPKAKQSYQWLRDGQIISGATGSTYTLNALDALSVISVAVTVTALGYQDRTVNISTNEEVKLGALKASSKPTISGKTQVGETLQATTGTWSSHVSSVTYQWLRNGATIPGATAKTYALSAADAGKRISIRITGQRAGYVDATVISNASATVVKAKISAKKVRLVGKAKVGKKLSAQATWSTTPQRVTYVWKANGKKVASGSKSVLKLKPSYAGKRITVTVKANKAGYAQAKAVSPAKKVARR